MVGVDFSGLVVEVAGVLSPDLRLLLLLIVAAGSAVIYYHDLKTRIIPRSVFEVFAIGIGLFWSYVFWRVGGIPYAVSAAIFFGMVGVGALILAGVLSKIARFAGGDVYYIALMAVCFPAPSVWGSSFNTVPSIVGFMPLDFVLNSTLTLGLFILGWVIYQKLIARTPAWRGPPLTPIIGGVFVGTILFGAIWRPVLMPIINFVISFV